MARKKTPVTKPTLPPPTVEDVVDVLELSDNERLSLQATVRNPDAMHSEIEEALGLARETVTRAANRDPLKSASPTRTRKRWTTPSQSTRRMTRSWRACSRISRKTRPSRLGIASKPARRCRGRSNRAEWRRCASALEPHAPTGLWCGGVLSETSSDWKPRWRKSKSERLTRAIPRDPERFPEGFPRKSSQPRDHWGRAVGCSDRVGGPVLPIAVGEPWLGKVDE